MAHPNSPDPSAGGVTEKSGLPPIAPDTVEQDEPEMLDNIIPTRGDDLLPVVGLGGSAGCIPALQRFFSSMPADSGMAFVVVIHLAAEHESIMDEIIGRATTMRVLQVADGLKLEPNHVYVIPPGKLISAADGRLRITALEPERGKRVAVDLFFRRLADTHGPHAAAIVLSGADGDGALGIKRIKERGGLTVAQDPDEAEHPSMPRSAIDTGMVDWVLPVEQMPARLLAYRANADRLTLPSEDGPQLAKLSATGPDTDENALREVLAHMRTRTGRDFSYYKRATVVRRISRRMQVNGVATIPEYLLFLRMHPGEAGALVQDLLISVTNFFRDRECFEALESYLPSIFARKAAGDVVRVWTAGCATGEEAYSIAILLLEHAARMDSPPAIQVFATDLAEDVIAAARDGLYPFTIQADVSEERLRRFFQKEHRGFRARRELRECVLFAVHDLLKDAPFSRLDLFTCRNLLIYLTTEAQKRVFEMAHFALKPEGWLFIGTSEAVDEESGMWIPVDKKRRIYRQRPGARMPVVVPIGPSTLERAIEAQGRAKAGPYLHGPAFSQTIATALERDAQTREGRQVSWEELHFKLIERFSPPSLIVTRDHDIVHMSENAGQFLHFRGGEPSVNLLKVVHPMLRVELRAALFRAAQANAAVEAFRVPVEMEGKTLAVDIRVSPAQEIAPEYMLVVFAVRDAADSDAVQARQEAEPAVRHLEREIEQMKTRLRDTIEQYEASSEELKASNEELQAMNEELRSSAEELETSREELQSVNEELSTVNSELKRKVDDLGHANSDLSNLMAATGVATIFLDRTLTITRYTPSAVALFRVIPGDLGRPLTDLNHRLNYPELKADAERVLDTLIPAKREVTDGERWFLAQLLPYRTAEDRIAGVVLTFVDVTDTREATQALAASEQRLQTLADAVPQIIWANDGGGVANYFNRRWFEYTGLTLEESSGLGWQAIVHPDDAQQSIDRWNEAQAIGEVFETEYRLRSADGSYRWFIGRNVPVRDAAGHVTGWFGTATDIHDSREATAALRTSEERLRFAMDAADIYAWEFDAKTLQTRYAGNPERVLGFQLPEDLQAMIALIHPDDRGDVSEKFEAAPDNGGRFDAEFRFVHPQNGEIIWQSSHGLFIGGESEPRFVGITQNITARRRAEEALRVSQERLRLVVENAREYAIFSLDLDRRVTSWNPGAEAILGYSAEEAIGRRGDIIFTPEDRAASQPEQEALTALTEGRAADERWHVRKDGSRFWGSGVMMAMHDTHGEAIGLVKIFRDQTAELRAKEALEQSLRETESARAEAEAAGKAKDHFLAVLSHELRTPLTPVLMAVSTLGRDTSLSETARDALGMIQRNVMIEAHFIDDLLDLTRVARGKLELVREPMDLHEAVRHAMEVATPDIEAKGQQLRCALDAPDHTLVGDSRRLQQAFWNLLKNASKFTPEGGAISLHSRNEPAVSETPGSTAAPRRIVVEVTDSGIGFDPADAERIFDAFAQANKEVTLQFGGLGLGLAISKATIVGHGGTVQARSAGPGQGATFTIELPLT